MTKNIKKKHILFTVLGVILILLGFLFFYPAKGIFKAAVFYPEEAPVLEGPLAPNNNLQRGFYIGEGELDGPEDIAMGPDGYFYTGTSDGYIKKVTLAGKIENFVHTGGRPVGMDFDSKGNLYVADSHKGFLKVAPDGEISILATQINGQPLRFIDGLEVGPDDMVYFSQASWKYELEENLLEVLEAQTNGKLLRYNPENNKIEVLLDKLHFPNGIAISPEGDYLLFNETSTFTVHRYWLKGDKRGAHEILIESLPGSPDGISLDSDGNYMVTFATTRNSSLDSLHPHPLLKNVVAKLPESMKPEIEKYGLVVVFSPEGKYLRSYHDPDGKFITNVTAAVEYDGKLILGSYDDHQILVVDK